MGIDCLQMWRSGRSLRAIARACGHSIVWVKARLPGVSDFNRWQKTCTTEALLDTRQRQIIDGLLLSDGCLGIESAYGRTPRFHLPSVEREFVEYVRDSLPFHWSWRERSAQEDVIKGRPVSLRAAYTIRTRVDLALTSFYERWYWDGHKVVPLDLVITPTLARFWFYGDGSSTWTGHRKNNVVVTLCTDSFTTDECEFLRDQWLKVCPSVRFSITSNHRLRLYSQASISAFLDFMGQPELSCFAYKWKRPLALASGGLEARLVAMDQIKSMRATGLSYNRIAATLIENGVVNSRGRINWDPGMVWRLFHPKPNKLYKLW